MSDMNARMQYTEDQHSEIGQRAAGLVLTRQGFAGLLMLFGLTVTCVSVGVLISPLAATMALGITILVVGLLLGLG